LNDERAAKESGAMGTTNEKLARIRDLAGHPAPDATNELVEFLKDDVSAVVESSISALSTLSRPGLGQILADIVRLGDIQARNAAAQIVTQTARLDMAPIVDLLDDQSADTRIAIAAILSQTPVRTAVEPLIRALSDENLNVVIAATEALGKARDSRAVQPLAACLVRPETWLNCAAARSLGEIGDTTAVALLTAVPTTADRVVLFSVIGALGDLGDVGGIGYLQEIVAANQKGMSEFALTAISSIAEKCTGHQVEIARQVLESDTLVDFIKNHNEEVIVSATKLRALTGDPNALEQLLNLFDSSSELVMEAFVDVFIDNPPDDVRPFVRILDNPGMPDSLKRPAIKVLSASGSDQAVQALHAHLEMGSEDLGPDLVQGLAEIGSEKALETLLETLTQSDARLREACLTGLAGFGCDRSFEAIVSMLSDADPEVRTAAVSAARSVMTAERALRLGQNLFAQEDPCAGAVLLALRDHLDKDLIEIMLSRAPEAEGELMEAILSSACVCRELITPEQRVLLADALARAIEHGEERLRIVAIKSAPGIGAEDTADTLIRALESDPSMRVRYTAAQALAETGVSSDNERELLRLLPESEPLVQSVIADTLSKIGSKASVPPLQQLALSENHQIKQAAIEALDILRKGQSRDEY
jgi:HEAT repeat protein